MMSWRAEFELLLENSMTYPTNQARKRREFIETWRPKVNQTSEGLSWVVDAQEALSFFLKSDKSTRIALF